MRNLSLHKTHQIKKLLEKIGVDKYGIKIMLPKARYFLLSLENLSNIAANILKQEMLSFGAEAAISRGALNGQSKNTDALLMGTFAQYTELIKKLKIQPFGLRNLALELKKTLENSQKENYSFACAGYNLKLGKKTFLMAILNITPDSFSGDGLSHLPLEHIQGIAEEKIKQGADILDIGAESSRPGAKRVSVKEESRRLLPVLKALCPKSKIPVSVDTYKPEVAKCALDNGAAMINDISGLRDKDMPKIIARYKAGVVIMHMQGNPRTMQRNPHYKCVISEIFSFFKDAIERALEAGIKKENIILDPGIGFGKDLAHNLEIIRRLGEFKSLGLPILIGVSRKSFLGKLTHTLPQERIFASISAAVLAALNGADILRVHDVKETYQALRILDAISKPDAFKCLN